MEAAQTRPVHYAPWGGVGGLWALAVLGLPSIGLFVLPLAALATVFAAKTLGRAGVVGLPLGALVVSAALLVPFLT